MTHLAAASLVDLALECGHNCVTEQRNWRHVRDKIAMTIKRGINELLTATRVIFADENEDIPCTAKYTVRNKNFFINCMYSELFKA